MSTENESERAAQELRSQLGDLAGVEVLHNCILVAIYQRPEKTKGGIILADSTRDEDKYQSKVGLVVKKGPLAFKEDARTDFGGSSVDIDQWVTFRVGDGWSIGVNGVACRMVQDVNIKAVVANPALIW